MECCVFKGTKEIGGSCVELSFEGERIILDIGLPLDTEKADISMVPNIKGILEKTDDLKGVIVSHYHQDHCGLLPFIDKDILIAIGKHAKNILNTSSYFMKRDYCLENYISLENRKSIFIGKFKITPYIVDHSAYDAYALLIEAGGKKLFYTGDLRAHGRKSALFDYMLKNIPKDIDCLLLEGTSLGRLEKNQRFATESEIEEKYVSSFKEAKGISFVIASGQNIDRIVTLYRAAKRTGKQLILDPYVIEVLKATDNNSIPKLHWDNIKVFIPEWERSHIAKTKRFDLIDEYREKRIYIEHILQQATNSVMLFRSSMILDFQKTPEIVQSSNVIFSMWEGYLNDRNGEELKAFFDNHQVGMSLIHTSGHADVPTLKKLAEAINPQQIVPIHTFKGEEYPSLFQNVHIKADGEIWKI